MLDAETAQRCIDAGAEFIVSPGFDLETVKLANRQDKLVMAGALTPTEVITAWKAGSDFVKIFPCGTVGGAKYIKALKGPLPQVPMVPTGGVNLKQPPTSSGRARPWASAGNWFPHPRSIRQHQEITEAARSSSALFAKHERSRKRRCSRRRRILRR